MVLDRGGHKQKIPPKRERVFSVGARPCSLRTRLHKPMAATPFATTNTAPAMKLSVGVCAWRWWRRGWRRTSWRRRRKRKQHQQDEDGRRNNVSAVLFPGHKAARPPRKNRAQWWGGRASSHRRRHVFTSSWFAGSFFAAVRRRQKHVKPSSPMNGIKRRDAVATFSSSPSPIFGRRNGARAHVDQEDYSSYSTSILSSPSQR